jgi:hypothetical protein
MADGVGVTERVIDKRPGLTLALACQSAFRILSTILLGLLIESHLSFRSFPALPKFSLSLLDFHS